MKFKLIIFFLINSQYGKHQPIQIIISTNNNNDNQNEIKIKDFLTEENKNIKKEIILDNDPSIIEKIFLYKWSSFAAGFLVGCYRHEIKKFISVLPIYYIWMSTRSANVISICYLKLKEFVWIVSKKLF